MVENKVKIIGKMDNTLDHTFESANRVYDTTGISPAMNTCGGGGLQPMILEEPVIVATGNRTIEETKCVGGLPDNKWGTQFHQQDRVYKGDIALALPANIPQGSYKYCVAMRGRGENNEQQLEPNRQGVVNSLTTVQKDNLVMESPNYRIRKLTPKECWRLMGFTDTDFENARAVNSATQCYKQAGNSIVKQVLMALFSQLNIKGVKPWNEVHK